LDEVSEIRSGVTLGRRLTGRTIRVPYLRVANVQDGHLDFSRIKEVELLESEADKWKLLSGDLLLTERGDWDKLGRGTVWREEIRTAFIRIIFSGFARVPTNSFQSFSLH
jgi:type I restriction enzyme, S subunit